MPVVAAIDTFDIRETDMLPGFIGLIPSNIAVIISILSILMALKSPPSKRATLMTWIIVVPLAVLEVLSSFTNQYLIVKQQKTVSNNRIELQNTIGDLLEKGKKISDSLRKYPIANLLGEENNVVSWEHTAEDFLRLNFGRAYIIRFQSCAGLAPQGLASPTGIPDLMWTEQSNYWSEIQCRMFNLERFSAQIPAAS